MSETSLSLLERIRRAPDESAWRRLVDLYAPLIRHWLRQAALQQADRDDLEQEVLAVMVRKLPEFQRERTGSFRAWLRVVCLNAVRAYFRSRRPAAADSQELSQLEDPNGALTKLWDAEHDRHRCGGGRQAFPLPVAIFRSFLSLQRVHDVPEASKHQDEEHSVGEDLRHQHLPNCARDDFLPIRAPREGFRGRRQGERGCGPPPP